MKKRILAILLCLCMALTLLPGAALAADVSVKVRDVTLTSTDGSAVYALTDSSRGEVTTEGATALNYNVKWDGSVLTLRNACIVESDVFFGVSADHALTITLVGASTIVGGGHAIYIKDSDLTINGDGSLTTRGGDFTTGASCGIRAKNVTIGGGAQPTTVTAVGGTTSRTASGSYGISASNVRVEAGARLTAVGGATSGDSSNSYGVEGAVTVNGLLVAKSGKVGGSSSYIQALNRAPTTGSGITRLDRGVNSDRLAVYGDGNVYAVYEGNVNSSTTVQNHIEWDTDGCTLTNIIIAGVPDNGNYVWSTLYLENRIKLTCNGYNVVLGADRTEQSNGVKFGGSTSSITGNIVVIGGDASANTGNSYGIVDASTVLDGTGVVIAGTAVDRAWAFYDDPEPAAGVEAQGDYDDKVYSWHPDASTPAAADFNCDPPADLTYDGDAKEAAVTATVSGMGAVSVKYYDDSGTALASAPKTPGTYTVKIDVEPSAAYDGAADLTSDGWKFTITAKQLTVSGTTADSKRYDGRTAAVVHCGTVSGIISGDDVNVTASGAFDTKDVGTGKTVTVVYEISGGDAGNYIKPADDTAVADITAAPAPSPTVYLTTAGAEGTWTRGAARGYSFTFSAPSVRFRSLSMDGATVPAGNYDKREGSTVITLHADYLETLSVGEHSLRAAFSDGYALTSFTIAEAVNPFADVEETDWFYEDVMYSYINGMMEGTGDATFDPHGTTTRGMAVTMLYRLAGEPAVTGECPFGDVANGMYYERAVIWAAENKLADGYGGGLFGPGDAVTREQLAALLYRYEQYEGGGLTGEWTFRLDFPDADTVSDWAYEALCWCTMNGLIEGGDGGALSPQGPAERCQTAAMLHRFCEKAAR